MDCCNYLQPYTGAGHFYQQHHLSYENMNTYLAYSTAPVSNAIEASVRYNRLPPAYPTDYVYNPKEARLRKAMREQSRELSRHQNIQPTTTPSSSGTTTEAHRPGNSRDSDGLAVSSTGAFLAHPMTCASPNRAGMAAVSSLPNNTSINTNRIINPWFSVGHGAATNHLKPILTPRVLSLHQQSLDKTNKDVIRKQIDCGAAGAFPLSGYEEPVSHRTLVSENTNSNQNSNEYCIMGEFSDGQKWHLYQDDSSAYHSRGGATMASIPKINDLHRNIQNSNSHPGHWTEFCGLPLPQNTMVRGPRHMIFLQDQENQHCVFPEGMHLSYGSNKINMNHRLHSSYSQPERQEEGKRLIGTSTLVKNVANSSRNDRDSLQREEQKTARDEEEGVQQKPQKVDFKQPLPGFHQAFGSTEIGRFSRSEFFANMVGDSNNVTVSSNDQSCGDDEGDDVASRLSIVNHLRHNGSAEVDSNDCPDPTNSNSNSTNNFSNLPIASYYNETRSPSAMTARWHSPCVSAIGSEI